MSEPLYCTCSLAPKCEYHHCTERARWSVFTAPGRWINAFPYGRLHFMCERCKVFYFQTLSKPLKGIDRPEYADDDWRPSLLEHIRHARIALAFEERDKGGAPKPDLEDFWDRYWRDYGAARGWTAAQYATSAIHRDLIRKYGSGEQVK